YGAPPGWGAAASATPAPFTWGIDKTNHRGGEASAYIRRLSSVPLSGFATITQTIKADAYRGKRVRWSGWVAHQGVFGGFGGGLWMRVDGPGVTPSFDNML